MTGVRETDAICIEADQLTRIRDIIALEEPLLVRLKHRGVEHSLGLTMRTPGSDEALIYGFVYSEGIINSLQEANDIEYGSDEVLLTLSDTIEFDSETHRRVTTMTSACGVCGKESLTHLPQCHEYPLNSEFQIYPDDLVNASLILSASQTLFKLTGGTHAAGAFDLDGNLIFHEEDVGRHNAMDKLIGKLMLNNINTSQHFVMVSGRSSFELVQKAIRAGFPILGSVGAASSLAIDLAREHDLTLANFVKDNRMVIHSSSHRIIR